jgi:hypothetical protein
MRKRARARRVKPPRRPARGDSVQRREGARGRAVESETNTLRFAATRRAERKSGTGYGKRSSSRRSRGRRVPAAMAPSGIGSKPRTRTAMSAEHHTPKENRDGKVDCRTDRSPLEQIEQPGSSSTAAARRAGRSLSGAGWDGRGQPDSSPPRAAARPGSAQPPTSRRHAERAARRAPREERERGNRQAAVRFPERSGLAGRISISRSPGMNAVSHNRTPPVPPPPPAPGGGRVVCRARVSTHQHTQQVSCLAVVD